MQIYLVGGAVRNKLLNLPVHEYDWVVVGATPEQLLAQGYEQVGRDFPVFLHPQTHDEYALARTERKSGSGHTGFVCHAEPDVSLEQDLLRRDLTINAIAQDADGTLIDPYNGVEDIKQRILRHVSPAFKDDPLRVLRLARFAATFAHLGFTIAQETQELISDMVKSGELDTLTPERVWKETEKALNTNAPQIFFAVLRQCGALAILYPELDALFGVPAPEKWHPEIDTGIHALLTLEQATKLSDDIVVRFAALFHDAGKSLTPKENWPHHHNHCIHGVPLIVEMAKRVRLPNPVRDFTILAVQYHDIVHKAEELPAQVIVQLFNGLDVWRKPENLYQLILVSKADCLGRTGWENKPYPQAEYLMQAFDVARSITAKEIIAEGITGNKIKDELYQRRIAAISLWQQDKKNAG